MTATFTTARSARTAEMQRRRGPAAGGRTGGWRFLVPAVAGVSLLVWIPFVWTIYISFTQYGGLGAPRWLGIDNYIAAVRDPFFLSSLGNTFLWVIGTIALPVVLGLVLAVVTYALPGGHFFRIAFLLPYALSGAMVGIVWGFIFTGEGALSQVLIAVGVIDEPIRWLAVGPQNTIMMILAATWQATGVNILLFVIGLQSIPTELTEAARLDGASGWSLFRDVTWPLLRPLATVVVALSIIGSLKTFDIVWLMTGGGPGRSSETLAVTMYREALINREFGSGSAVAVILTVIVAVASIAYLRRQFRSEV